MRLRSLLVAAVVLVALAVGLYFSNKQEAAKSAKPPADAAPKILSLSDGDITKISVKAKGGAETVLQRTTAGKWQMTSPEYPADQEAVNQLVTSAANITSERVVEDKMSDPKVYGFNDPALKVDITSKGGKVSEFLIGDDTPTNGGSYASLQGDPRVFHGRQLRQERPGQNPQRSARQAAADLRSGQAQPRRADRQEAGHRRVRTRQGSVADRQAQTAARRRLASGRADPQAARTPRWTLRFRGGRQESNVRVRIWNARGYRKVHRSVGHPADRDPEEQRRLLR